MRAAIFVLFQLALIPIAGAQSEGWPQEVIAESGAVVTVYQPQAEEFTGNHLAARAAVSIKSEAAGGAPVFGAIWIEAKLDTDREARTAVIRDIDVTDIRFADATEDQKERLAALLESSVESSTWTISVDQLLADLDAAGMGQVEADLKHEPPVILMSKEPAILVSIDGEPVFNAIDGSNYEYVINTAFLIVRGGTTLYLYVGSNTWYRADNVGGPWSQIANVPDEVKGFVEPTDGGPQDVGDAKIIIATEPTELIVSDGDAVWVPVEGMDLLYLDNTDSEVFLELTTQSYYILLSGRWYRGQGMLGDIAWVHIPNDELPEPFSDIPEDSVNATVLSQVAGTQQARDAALDNTIPETAAIDRNDQSFNVSYDGEPDFEPIEDIQVEYAVNTVDAVFKYGNRYYGCHDGVWYTSLDPEGPWGVAAEVPDAIYRIPASNPHHNVTYVVVYDVTPEVVYVGYTPGYYGSYYYRGTVVYGTGWYYRPWYGPYYYPRYPTWGFRVHYNPWTGWSFGLTWTNGPFRVTIGRHSGWYRRGPYYRPRPRPYPHGGYRKSTARNQAISNNRPTATPSAYNRPENRARNAERPATANTQQARPAASTQNNVLTDKSGNVYQRGSNGDWSQRDSSGQWSQPSNMDRAGTAQQPSARQQPSTSQMPSYDRSSGGASRPQLERDYSSRQHGAQRSQNYQRQRPQQRRR